MDVPFASARLERARALLKTAFVLATTGPYLWSCAREWQPDAGEWPAGTGIYQVEHFVRAGVEHPPTLVLGVVEPGERRGHSRRPLDPSLFNRSPGRQPRPTVEVAKRGSAVASPQAMKPARFGYEVPTHRRNCLAVVPFSPAESA